MNKFILSEIKELAVPTAGVVSLPTLTAMMVEMLLYVYCADITSFRKVEGESLENIAFQILASGYSPERPLSSLNGRTQRSLQSKGN